MTATETPERRFIDALVRRADQRDGSALAAMAALRRGLGKPPGAAPEMFPIVVPWLGDDPSPRREEAYYLVAALFALHPVDWRREPGIGWTNLGASFARYAGATDRKSKSAERRFVALLNARRADLGEHLRHAVGLLRSREVPVDWAQLLRDVQDWDRPDRRVQRAWARGYWGSRTATSEDEEADDRPVS